MKNYTLTKIASLTKAEYTEEHKAISVSDGYHTMDELYEHRMALNVALFRYMHGIELQFNPLYKQEPWVCKSKLHNDGTMFEGYFIVACRFDEVAAIGQISYHYKLEHWDKFRIPEVERVPWEYDGHTPQDTITRLLSL